MSLPDRKQDEVRRMLEGAHPPVPADLGPHAAERGARLLRRRMLARRLMWVLLASAVVAFVVWAAVEQPWVAPPSEIAPPLEGW
ncbi:hypothetical protein AR457_13275 [Streptomyces agglomeratus]|uniref:Uncharacterized protein n=1 Tax=Streptomyces agglomeratus TaxID=285458 RepID=A0A1E5P6Y7_9ACTN|nr:hypothetical protein [Streptomyces agglomeratus]OEJ25290.1 hypothetical protein AS594_13105 [Streptomyces agglomeratus]OEJ40675.1 hypothetical protein BGK70_23375 [Streptomyces agglomeratus]OEJ44945.1 hypothetical protein AR457_13275 [Streptomyces agglomeratus]OEJ53221.1 hypothetical protein BGK72_22995 [Streptomyces agglomeratus]OEJ60557.1 hypothetical protein BGM19_23705 [Streptomyces agglomeratus]